MKKICAFLLGVGLMAAAVQAADQATSVNAVGFVNVVMLPSNSFSLVALNFNQVGGSNTISFSDLFSTNQLRGGASVSKSDKVALYGSDQQYYRYAFKAADMAFHQIAPLNRWNYESTNPVIRSGEGFWLISGSDFAATNTVTLAGQVITSSNATVNMQVGFQMIGNQYTADMVITNSSFPNAIAGLSVSTSDQISLFRNGIYYRYAKKSADGLWHMIAPSNRWNYEGTNISVTVGDGFWYKAISNSTWDTSIPYDLSK